MLCLVSHEDSPICSPLPPLPLVLVGVGDFSVWEFSGNPVYHCSYDYFAANDPTALHLVLFSLEESYETQLNHLTYWLNMLKALTLPQDSIGEPGGRGDMLDRMGRWMDR